MQHLRKSPPNRYVTRSWSGRVPDGVQITKELSIEEFLSQTYEFFKRDFMKYFTVYVVVEAIIGVVATIATASIGITKLPPSPTASQVLSADLSAIAKQELVTGLLALILGTIAVGTTIKMASEAIEGRQTDLQAGVRFTTSKILRIWVLGLLVGVIVLLGLIALIVPGIILAIMLCLAIPVLLIEGKGITESMTRSRKLVGGRWLKTFAFFFVLGVIVAVIGIIGSLIGDLFGPGRTIATDLISALYSPIVPVGLTVYYYSNVARLTPPAQPQQAWTQPSTAAPGMKFCPSCGNQLGAGAMFCSKCGARQPS